MLTTEVYQDQPSSTRYEAILTCFGPSRAIGRQNIRSGKIRRSLDREAVLTWGLVWPGVAAYPGSKITRLKQEEEPMIKTACVTEARLKAETIALECFGLLVEPPFQ